MKNKLVKEFYCEKCGYKNFEVVKEKESLLRGWKCPRCGCQNLIIQEILGKG